MKLFLFQQADASEVPSSSSSRVSGRDGELPWGQRCVPWSCLWPCKKQGALMGSSSPVLWAGQGHGVGLAAATMTYIALFCSVYCRQKQQLHKADNWVLYFFGTASSFMLAWNRFSIDDSEAWTCPFWICHKPGAAHLTLYTHCPLQHVSCCCLYSSGCP